MYHVYGVPSVRVGCMVCTDAHQPKERENTHTHLRNVDEGTLGAGVGHGLHRVTLVQTDLRRCSRLVTSSVQHLVIAPIVNCQARGEMVKKERSKGGREGDKGGGGGGGGED